MIRKLCEWLYGDEPHDPPQPPITFAPTVVYLATIDRLEHLYTLAYQHRERMEAEAAECCQLFGVDPDEDSLEADWCREIIYQGTDVMVVLDRIEALRAAMEVEE